MAYHVMLLPKVDGNATIQQKYEAGIVYAVMRNSSDAYAVVTPLSATDTYVCGVILAGRSSDPGGTSSRWLSILAFAQESGGQTQCPRYFQGSYISSSGYTLSNTYSGVYWNYGGSTSALLTPDNNAYPNIAPNCPIPVYDLSGTFTKAQNISLVAQAIISDIAWGMPPTDPYAGGGIAGPSGFPEATHDFTSDSISPPTVPTIGAYDAGFTRIYTSDETHIRALATYLWTTSLDWTQVQKLVNKPWDLIMGLNILPVTPASEQEFVYVGNLEIPVLMGRATQQFVTVDCGTIEIPTRWGTYLDFSPYTKLEIFLPYIGMREINPDDVMGKTLGVKYIIDIMSGSCVCFLSTISEDTEGNPLVQVLYTYSGTCASQVPVTSAQYTGMMEGITQIATSIIALQGNPTTAPVAISNIASGIVNITKPSVQRSGAISGTSGLMDIQKPYVIFTVPRMCTPEGQDKFIGYPSFITATLGDLTGYTEIEDVHLEGIPCTLSELQEIEKALKDGVIL